MKTGTAATVAVILLGGWTWAGDNATNQPPPVMRLELDLADGSHIIGTPKIESVPLQTAYARMDIPLKQILSVKMDDDHETASLALVNGDKLKGVIALKPLELTTVFGPVKIGVEHLRAIAVSSGEGLSAALKKGLVLYYSFDKDEGEKVIDRSGRANDGKASGARWTAVGRIGGAYDFNGSRDCVDVGIRQDLLTVNSISAWIKSSANGTRQTIVSKHASVNNGFPSAGYYLLKESDDRFLMWVGVNGNSGEAYSISRAAYTDSRWHHVVGVFNPETGRVDLYVDGENVTDYKTVSPGAVKGANQRPFFVGRATWGEGGSSSSWIGQIDEVMVFDRALSADKVQMLYKVRK